MLSLAKLAEVTCNYTDVYIRLHYSTFVLGKKYCEVLKLRSALLFGVMDSIILANTDNSAQNVNGDF